MISNATGTVIVLLMLSSLVATAQDPVKPGPVSSPKALALLEDAIRYQGPDAYAEPGAIRDLTVKIQSTVWDYSRTPTQRLEIGVRRYLKLDPERFRSEWTTRGPGGGTQLQGFDGRRYWYADSQGSQFLIGDDKEESRADIREEIKETRHLLRFFFLANLKGPRVTFRLLPDETVKVWGVEYPCHALRRDNRDPASTEPPVTLWFDTKTKALRKATAHASADSQKSLTFLFVYDEKAQPRVEGVLFPIRIEVREQPFGAEKDRRSLIATLLKGGIRFNTDIPPQRFLRPKPDPK